MTTHPEAAKAITDAENAVAKLRQFAESIPTLKNELSKAGDKLRIDMEAYHFVAPALDQWAAALDQIESILIPLFHGEQSEKS